MKISKTILETILPITVGTLLFISYFFVSDKFATNEAELETCERYELSTSVYLIFAFVIILISSLYQIVVGNWILKRNWNKFVLNIVNSIVFSIIFVLIFIGMKFFNGKTIEVKFSAGLFLAMLLLGLLISVLKSITEKYSNKF
ncbi:hypothetical protein [Flavobacterium sp. GNP001]